MARNQATAVQPVVSTEITSELIAYIEDVALREKDELAPQCRTVLRLLQSGAGSDQIQSELRVICLEFARSGEAQRSADARLAGTAARAVQLSPRHALEPILTMSPRRRQPRLGDGYETAAERIEALRHKLFLTVQEATEYSGLPQAVIRRLIAQDELPAVKTGGWRIKRTYLEVLGLRHLRKVAQTNI